MNLDFLDVLSQPTQERPMFMRLFPMFPLFPTKTNNLARTPMKTVPQRGTWPRFRCPAGLALAVRNQGEPGVLKNSSSAITWDGAGDVTKRQVRLNRWLYKARRVSTGNFDPSGRPASEGLAVHAFEYLRLQNNPVTRGVCECLCYATPDLQRNLAIGLGEAAFGQELKEGKVVRLGNFLARFFYQV